MREKISVTIEKKIVAAKGLNPEDAAAFLSLVPEGSVELTVVNPAANRLPAKQRKELVAVCVFARMPKFPGTLGRLAGIDPAGGFDLELRWDGDDPPDAVLSVGDKTLRIEVSDYPPDQASLMKAMEQMPGPAPLPAFHEGGCNSKTILEFMRKPVSMVEPHFSSAGDEATALFRFAEGAVRRKDEARCSEVLLLHGPVAFSFPAEEVIDYIVRNRRFVAIRAVAFVRANDCRVWATNLG